MALTYHKEKLCDTRLTEDKKAILDKAVDVFHIREGTTIISSFIGEPIEETYSVTKYSSQAGEPVKFSWSGILPYHHLWRGSGSGPDFLLDIVKEVIDVLTEVIPEGQMRVLKLKNNECIVITHHPLGFNDTEASTRHFSFTRTSMLA